MNRHVLFPVLGPILALALAGCGRTSPSGPLAPDAAARPGAHGDASFATLAAGGSHDLPEFAPDDFVAGVDNPWFPLIPGTVLRYESRTDEGLETIVVEVLTGTKEILGIQATVVRDRAYLDGILVEDTFDWYAQDEAGNVWYLGEDTKEYEDGQVVSTAGSWEAGVDGAEAGIVMLADPQPGDRYRQEFYEGEAEDMARVHKTGLTVTVPYGTFTDVLQTAEWTPLEPGQREYKYYARGVGLVLETSINGRQRVELVSVTGT